MIRTLLLMTLATVLLSCSISSRTAETNQAEDSSLGAYPLSPPFGLQTMEANILLHSTVVKATLSSVATDVVAGADDNFYAALKFTLRVSEYLKGSGAKSIVGIWVYGTPYETRLEAEAKGATLLADRDTRWDALDSIIFLNRPSDDERPLRMPATLLSPSNHYLLVWGSSTYVFDDQYSLYSRWNRRWLPAAPADDSGGARSPQPNNQAFLLEIPPELRQGVGRGAGSTSQTITGGTSRRANSMEAETITLGEIKTLVQTITTEYNGGDGSVAYKWCVTKKYKNLRYERNFPELVGTQWTAWDTEPALNSGLPAHHVIQSLTAYGPTRTGKIRYEFSGVDADLFEEASTEGIPYGYDIPYDDSEVAQVGIEYETMVRTTRPLPAGRYVFTLDEYWPLHAVCGYVMSNDWAVTVKAPADTLHEAFFDPVMDGTAIAADMSNGQLEPRHFVDLGGASATVERIEWVSDTVKVKVSPHTGLAGHKLDFIELDGTVSLSLDLDDATVDAANKTLSWTVTPQPWENGDKLMLRIAKVPLGIAMTEVPSTMTHGSSESLTVKASNLTSSNSYSIRLSTNNYAIGFGDTCSTIAKTVTLPSGNHFSQHDNCPPRVPCGDFQHDNGHAVARDIDGCDGHSRGRGGGIV